MRWIIDEWFQNCHYRIPGQETFLNYFIKEFVYLNAKKQGIVGFVLDGPTGMGKTHLAKQLLEYCPFDRTNLKYYDCVNIFNESKFGVLEEKIHSIFSLKGMNRQLGPGLIVLDNAEFLLGNHKTEEKDSDDRRDREITPEQKLSWLCRDTINRLNRCKNDNEDNWAVFIIAVTSDRSKISSEFRVPGKFSHFHTLNIATINQRASLLEYFLRNFQFETDGDRLDCIKVLSYQPTSGLSVADIESLCLETLQIVAKREEESNSEGNFRIAELKVSLNDFLSARRNIQPSSIVAQTTLQPKPTLMRPKIIGLDTQLKIIQRYISAPFASDDFYKNMGVDVPRGILLHGPSGCGKTMIASTLNTVTLPDDLELPITFISVDATQIRSKYLGKSDENLAAVFSAARQASPCVLFFDQIDALAAKRSGADETSDRLVTTFLVEMDGLKGKLKEDIVIVVGTCSRRENLDPAILRPGRLELHVEIPLPKTGARREFIEYFMRKAEYSEIPSNSRFNLSEEDIQELIGRTEGYSMAQLESLFKETALLALREDFNCETVEMTHFQRILQSI